VRGPLFAASVSELRGRLAAWGREARPAGRLKNGEVSEPVKFLSRLPWRGLASQSTVSRRALASFAVPGCGGPKGLPAGCLLFGEVSEPVKTCHNAVMSGDEPDIASLFAPVDIGDAVRGLLDEARAALAHLDDPVDAELWASDVIGALSTAGEAEAVSALVQTLVPAAETDASPEALTLLRVFAVIGSPDLRAAASEAAARLTKESLTKEGLAEEGAEIADAPWAERIGSPAVRDCWHYADVGGRQESLSMMFAYGDKQHTVSVLIDHSHGGKIKDVWVTKETGQLLATELAASSDPLVVFELIDADDARHRLESALNAGESPEQPDQAEDIAAHRALLQARLAHLTASD
jgi:hypothetical protein